MAGGWYGGVWEVVRGVGGVGRGACEGGERYVGAGVEGKGGLREERRRGGGAW